MDKPSFSKLGLSTKVEAAVAAAKAVGQGRQPFEEDDEYFDGDIEESEFTSIPRSIYWAIVTLTTVGYGDISPITGLGQFIASFIMIMGYGIIAVPTGIVTAELTALEKDTIHLNTQSCPNCAAEGHLDGAIHCFNCGAILNPEETD